MCIKGLLYLLKYDDDYYCLITIIIILLPIIISIDSK